MPYLLCTGLGNLYGTGNMDHCLHFKDWGDLERIVIEKLYQYVCVRAVPIFKN